MRTLRYALGAASAAVLGLAMSVAPAGAASATHFVGTFTPTITSQGCQASGVSPSTADMAGVPVTDPSAWGPVTGSWRVNVGTHTASARFVIYLKGAPHVAFTIPLKVTSVAGGVVQAVGPTGAGELTVTIDGTAMAYRIADYDSTSFMNPAGYCPGGFVTYHGTVDEAG